MAWWPSRRIIIVAVPVLIILAAGLIWVAKSQQNVPRRIVVILPSSSNPFWIDVQRGAEQAAATLQGRYSVQITASKDQDADTQVELLNAFLGRKAVDALVLGPASDVATVPVVSRYNQANIPVVVIDTELKKEEVDKHQARVDAFIGSDNRSGGKKAAAAMIEALKNAKSKRVLLIEGSRVHQSAIDRADGFIEVAKGAGLDIVQLPGLWKRDRAQELVSSQLVRGPVGGIFASNDDMAMGAIAALKSRNIQRSDWPILIGFDATRDGLTAVASGEMYTTIAQDARKMGHAGVISAKKLLEGEPVIKRDFLDVDVVPPTFRR